MKKLLGLVLAISLAGCGSLNEKYVEADRATYDAVAPDYELFLKSGVVLDENGKILKDANGNNVPPDSDWIELRRSTLILWNARIKEAEKALVEGN